MRSVSCLAIHMYISPNIPTFGVERSVKQNKATGDRVKGRIHWIIDNINIEYGRICIVEDMLAC